MTQTMNNRAYSVLNIKALDDDKRELSGIATTPTPDRVGDIVEPLGAKFAAELPLLWQHEHGKPVGTVKFDKPTKNGITFKASLPKIEEPGALKDMVDMAWQAVKAKLVRGVSIGFRPIEYSFIDGGGIRFSETEIYELSLVTVPAQADATIQTIKSIDTAMRAASGNPAQGSQQPAKATPPPGESGTKKQPASGGFFYARTKGNEVNIQDQIKTAEEALQTKSAQLLAIQEKASAEGRTKDAAEREEFDTLTAEVESCEKELTDLRKLEKLNVGKATPVVATTTKEASDARAPVVVKNTQKLEPGIEFARYAMCVFAAKGDHEKAFKIARAAYPQSERVVKTLQFQADSPYSLGALMEKANVNAGTTLDATWASPLVDYQTFAGDFVEFLRPQTIIGKFGTGGVPGLRRIPFNVRITGQTSGGSGYWVGEGAPKPLTKFDFNATELRWAKVANIAVLTEELMRFSNPSAERLVRDALAAALIERLDIDFIDPDKAAVANVSPASITNGVNPISAGGATTDDAIRNAIKALWAPFITANNPPTSAVYIMSASLALSLSLRYDALGNRSFPGIGMNGGTFNGIPVIVSEYVKNDGGSAGSILILANASDIWLADDGQVTIDASREASLQMDDAPSNNSATGTESQVVSMFQTNSVALRAERFINWAKRRSSAVQYLDAVNW